MHVSPERNPGGNQGGGKLWSGSIISPDGSLHHPSTAENGMYDKNEEFFGPGGSLVTCRRGSMGVTIVGGELFVVEGSSSGCGWLSERGRL